MMKQALDFAPEGEDAPILEAEAQQPATGIQQQPPPVQPPPQQLQAPIEQVQDMSNVLLAPEVLEQPITPSAETLPVATDDTLAVIQPSHIQQQPPPPPVQAPLTPSHIQPQLLPSQQLPPPVMQLPSQPPQINPIHHLAMQSASQTQPNPPPNNPIAPQQLHITPQIPQPIPQPQLSSQTYSQPQITSPVPPPSISPIPQPQLASPVPPQIPPSLQIPPSPQGAPLMMSQTSPPIITSQPVLRPNPPSPYQPPPQPSTPPPRQVKFENALDFLDQVKSQFAKQPRVYNQFLDIMKDFKAQYIDTPGVIARVTELFKGHKHLILGFNTFLPPGYKIELPEEDKPAPLPPPPVAPPVVPPASAPRKQPEFDHARNYVKKIKTRFSASPEVYKQFLEILHTYHKEQHTIKDVFDQVAKLFANHADLLDEFTHFLPDPVASNSIQVGAPTAPSPVPNVPQSAVTAARGSKSRPARYPQKGKGVAPSPSPVVVEKEVTPSRPERGTAIPERRAPKRSRAGTRAEENIAHPSKRRLGDEESEPVRGERAEREKAEREKERVAPSGNYEEIDFFYRVKQGLDNKVLYHEFLKCLNLFSQEIINRPELVLLVKDLLSRHQDLFDWFKQFIGFDDHSLELLEKKEAASLEENRQPWSEIDFTTCKRYGPSYRALPKNFVGAKCSGRTELCHSVLNDHWVSVPTGSEDFTFKNMRKNQYEEVLFKCEDERYELDLVVELNCSAIRALEPYAQDIEKMTEDEASNYKLKAPLDILHVRSIERLYGDKGPEIIEGLYANPAGAIPIILRRLKQKDQEWTKSRREWNKVWHEITEKNYYKSLDHQSFFFKQQEKKNLSPKVLLAEIKMQYADRLREKEAEKEAAAARERRTSQRGKDKEAAKEKEAKAEHDEDAPKYHLKYNLDNPAIFQDISELVSFAADKNFSKVDKEKIDTFLKHFLNVFFKLDAPEAAKEGASVDVKTEPMDVDSRDAVRAEKHTDDKNKEDKRVRQLFFGNNTFYIFFRLLQILYERLAKAKDLAKLSQKAKWNSKPTRPVRATANGDTPFSQPSSPYPSPLPSPNPHSAAPTTPPLQSPTGASTTSPTMASAEDKKDRYQSFLEKLYSLLAGATDQTHYEDETRGLLGISSYVLFTLDKLVVQLARQLQALLSSDNCSKLLSLYAYESQRPTGVVESVYHMSCAEFLSEERLFLFEFEQSPHPGQFTLQLLDPSSQTIPKFAEFSFEPSKYSEYVQSFTRDSSKLDPRKHHVFLVRNQKINRENVAILNGVVNENNLECRICLSTYRLFYVEDTEDFFFRPKAARSPTNPNSTPPPATATATTPSTARRNINKVLDKLVANKTA